ncbi:hypothetical protein ACFFP0_00725 [Rhizobium puerariae]|uniref:Uncharacterized protein n=1 Tax=Rhizobium puerariae TaxID=1585791 RepID=A0ABV6A9T6_9HYPH
MTALNIFVLDHAALIVTDSRTVPAGNAPPFDHAKCFTIPHLRLAVATRGKASLLPSLVRIISRFAGDFEAARALMQDDIRAFSAVPYDDVSERDAWADDWDIIVAGWMSAENRPAAFMICNHEKHGLSAWTIHDIEYMLSTPYIPYAVKAASFDPVGQAVALVQAQHDCHPREIGGYVTGTFIDGEGISQIVMGKVVEHL